MSVYYNKYRDFISGENVVAPLYGSTDPNAPDYALGIAAIANGDFQAYQTYTRILMLM